MRSPPQPRGGRSALAGERSFQPISIGPPLAVIDALFAQEAEWKMSNPLAHLRPARSFLDCWTTLAGRYWSANPMPSEPRSGSNPISLRGGGFELRWEAKFRLRSLAGSLDAANSPRSCRRFCLMPVDRRRTEFRPGSVQSPATKTRWTVGAQGYGHTLIRCS